MVIGLVILIGSGWHRTKHQMLMVEWAKVDWRWLEEAQNLYWTKMCEDRKWNCLLVALIPFPFPVKYRKCLLVLLSKMEEDRKTAGTKIPTVHSWNISWWNVTELFVGMVSIFPLRSDTVRSVACRGVGLCGLLEPCVISQPSEHVVSEKVISWIKAGYWVKKLSEVKDSWDPRQAKLSCM